MKLKEELAVQPEITEQPKQEPVKLQPRKVVRDKPFKNKRRKSD
jgi:hypothetical protein